MPRRSNDQVTDRLYQVPPGDFTRERNALAKEVGGEDGKRIRALPRPSVSAWAVNQLYWHDRETYEELVAASERLRSAHRSVLGGRRADLVGADAAHRDAVKAALTSTLRLVRSAGQNISGSTHNEIAQTLETLSAEDAAGHLAKPLHPEGFEALQGMPVRGRIEKPAPSDVREPRPRRVEEKREEDGRASQAEREREQKAAKHAMRTARGRERRDRATVLRLQKRIAQAERTTAAAKTSLDRAQAAEAKLRTEMQRAQESLEQSERAVREMSGRF